MDADFRTLTIAIPTAGHTVELRRAVAHLRLELFFI